MRSVERWARAKAAALRGDCGAASCRPPEKVQVVQVTASGATFNVAEYDAGTGLIGLETSYTEYYPG